MIFTARSVTKTGSGALLMRDFSKATDDAKKILGDMDIHPLAFSVVVEMVSQMGMESVSGFKKSFRCS